MKVTLKYLDYLVIDIRRQIKDAAHREIFMHMQYAELQYPSLVTYALRCDFNDKPIKISPYVKRAHRKYNVDSIGNVIDAGIWAVMDFRSIVNTLFKSLSTGKSTLDLACLSRMIKTAKLKSITKEAW